ncbi:hypothetical protein [Flagellimonas sp.]|uniref:hypothetical protein n=1 Tax=Flagellimonas sp. TaxID=2058762 RepID=UPI003F4A4D98
MKKTTQPLRILCICTFLMVSCKRSAEKAIPEEPTALQVVEKGIEMAGTMEKWKNIASLEYTKKSRLLLENGEVESDVTQRHHYIYRPNKSVRISWVVDKDSFLIVHNDSVSQKFKNDSLVDQGTGVKATVNSATYVLGMPFKLLDTGTTLSYDGLKSFNAIDTVHAVNATYAPEQHKNHSTQDEWWYHFDKNTGAFVGSMVYHAPTHALIENLSMITEKGLTFPEHRKSYRCDADGNKVFLRAEFWYSNYSIEFLSD